MIFALMPNVIFEEMILKIVQPSRKIFLFNKNKLHSIPNG